MQDVIYLFGPYANLLNQFWGDSLLRPDPIEIDLVAAVSYTHLTLPTSDLV